jgi:hypothetical protein
MREFLLGFLMMGYSTAAAFFLRFYRASRDRLFAWFGVAFLLLALNQVAFIAIGDRDEQVVVYVIRLVAFVLILWAIVDKNRRDA